jgi:regulation of enolase protein 1 (concanavalin A-like superfamily)
MGCVQPGVRVIPVLVLLAASFGQQPTIDVVPGNLKWQNAPVSWQIEPGNKLTIRSGKETDWFVDPFDGTIHNTAPMLLFAPANDYVFNAKVKVGFNTKWDAGALMIWADNHHWAKLSFELSPAKQPTLVTVVTRGLSDDCNSVAISGDTVYLQIAKSGPAYVFYFSSDAKNWQVLRVFSLGDGLKPRVGFESQSPAGAGTEVVFSEIHYSAKKIADIYNYNDAGF